MNINNIFFYFYHHDSEPHFCQCERTPTVDAVFFMANVTCAMHQNNKVINIKCYKTGNIDYYNAGDSKFLSNENGSKGEGSLKL